MLINPKKLTVLPEFSTPIIKILYVGFEVQDFQNPLIRDIIFYLSIKSKFLFELNLITEHNFFWVKVSNSTNLFNINYDNQYKYQK